MATTMLCSICSRHRQRLTLGRLSNRSCGSHFDLPYALPQFQNARSRFHDPMNQQRHQLSLLNRIARVLLCLVFIHAVIGKLMGFDGVAGAIAAKGLPLAPLLLVAAMTLMAVGSALVITGWRARLGGQCCCCCS